METVPQRRGGPRAGKAVPVPIWGLGIAQQEKTDSRRVQGAGLGARRGWPRRKPQPPGSGPCPSPAGRSRTRRHPGCKQQGQASQQQQLLVLHGVSRDTASRACPDWSSDSLGHVLLLSCGRWKQGEVTAGQVQCGQGVAASTHSRLAGVKSPSGMAAFGQAWS